jgi:integrase-like protein
MDEVRLKTPVPPLQVPTEDEVRAVLEECCRYSTFERRRNYAAILIMIDAGLRISELVHTLVQDWDLNERSLLVRRGKGGETPNNVRRSYDNEGYPGLSRDAARNEHRGLPVRGHSEPAAPASEPSADFAPIVMSGGPSTKPTPSPPCVEAFCCHLVAPEWDGPRSGAAAPRALHSVHDAALLVTCCRRPAAGPSSRCGC